MKTKTSIIIAVSIAAVGALAFILIRKKIRKRYREQDISYKGDKRMTWRDSETGELRVLERPCWAGGDRKPDGTPCD